MSQAKLIASLILLNDSNFHVGRELDEVHQLCQQHEGSQAHDWVHALVHRIEGDESNAAYWYRRAGKKRHSGTIEEEWNIIQSELKKA